MILLIIEDDHNKLVQLGIFMRASFPEADIRERRSYQSGLKEALSSKPDLILVDMTLPTYDISATEKGGRTRPFAGQEIMAQLKRRNLSAKAIVVTQFEKFGDENVTLDELKAVLAKNYPNIYSGTVFYQASESRWRAELEATLVKLGFLR